MAIFAESEKNQIEAWQLFRWQQENLPQLGLICRRGGGGLQFADHAMHVLVGNEYLRQQRFFDHAKIALGMIRRHAALITPEKMNLPPSELQIEFRGRQRRVKR